MIRMKILTVAAALALAASLGGAAELKVATVDLDQVFNAHPRTKAAETELKKQEEAVQAEMEEILAEGQALREEVNKLRARRTQETKIKQMREQVLKSRQAIVDELMAAVTQFAAANEYDLVFDRSGQTMNAIPLVLYADPVLDVTDRLIAYLEAKAGLPAAAK